MGAPGLVWEMTMDEEMAAGGTIHFLAMGTEDSASNEVTGWFMILVTKSGERKMYVKRSKYEPRIFKTYAGVAAFVKDHEPKAKTVTLPLYPNAYSMEEAWKLLDSEAVF